MDSKVGHGSWPNKESLHKRLSVQTATVQPTWTSAQGNGQGTIEMVDDCGCMYILIINRRYYNLVGWVHFDCMQQSNKKSKARRSVTQEQSNP